MRKCEQCGSELVQSENPSRPKTRFCSKKCNWAASNAARAEARRLKRVGRTCEFCGGPIPETVAVNATMCSEACRLKVQGKRAAARKKAARQAAIPPCRFCGGVIPVGSHAATRYCSKECRRKALLPGAVISERKRKYGVTAVRFAELLAEQDGMCAICRTATPGGSGSWHVDHCHASQVVRGLLCHDCNLALGNFKDNVANMRAAINYLERAAQVTVSA
ncbi:endonuclease VII domain-containing protein [Actinoplanes sp. CA-051413]|uniref:endonuclease VII domain-containing protein n=1 Tax=Actinoplanes sp. CA-051413 TaxID=3239899 RepID=UPI003D9907D7